MNRYDIKATLKNAFNAFIRGELLLRPAFNDKFIHIVYTFILFWALILLSIMVENTLSKIEKNKEILTDLQIYHTEKMVQLVSIGRITRTEAMLKDKGSDVSFPQKPASRIDAKDE